MAFESMLRGPDLLSSNCVCEVEGVQEPYFDVEDP
jgi:hypothetical protein